MAPNFIRWLEDIGAGDTGSVGGKNASLGEMVRNLGPYGITVPPGFAITADAYRHFLSKLPLRRTGNTTNRRTAQAAAAAIHGFQLPISIAIKTSKTTAAPNTVMILAAMPTLARISHSQIGSAEFARRAIIAAESMTASPD
jgi:phosphoenolpyruvate synthase/pyruvate phosphate dikinase